MKSLFGKSWHRVPTVLLAVLLVAVLTTGAVFAAPYAFSSFTTSIAIAEPMAGEYNLWGQYGGDSNWHPLGDPDSLTIDGSAGDVFNLSLRFSNYASDQLTINTVVTGGEGVVDFSGFPESALIPGDPSPWVEFNAVSITIRGDAAPQARN